MNSLVSLKKVSQSPQPQRHGKRIKIKNNKKSLLKAQMIIIIFSNKKLWLNYEIFQRHNGTALWWFK